jgi:hypothetical protein
MKAGCGDSGTASFPSASTDTDPARVRTKFNFGAQQKTRAAIAARSKNSLASDCDGSPIRNARFYGPNAGT